MKILFEGTLEAIRKEMQEFLDDHPKENEKLKPKKEAKSKAEKPIEEPKFTYVGYEKEKALPTITLADVEKKVMVITKDSRGNQAQVKGVLKQLNALNAEGKPKVTALKPEDYERFMEELEKIENAR